MRRFIEATIARTDAAASLKLSDRRVLTDQRDRRSSFIHNAPWDSPRAPHGRRLTRGPFLSAALVQALAARRFQVAVDARRPARTGLPRRWQFPRPWCRGRGLGGVGERASSVDASGRQPQERHPRDSAGPQPEPRRPCPRRSPIRRSRPRPRRWCWNRRRSAREDAADLGRPRRSYRPRR